MPRPGPSCPPRGAPTLAQRRRLSSATQRLARSLAERDGRVRLTGIKAGARARVAAELVREHGDAPVLVLAPTARRGDAIADDLRTALGERPDEPRVQTFPRHDTLPYDTFSPQPFILTARMRVLHHWSLGGREGPQVVVAPWSAFAARVPSRETLRARTVRLEVGQTIDRDALVERLVGNGYARMAIVEERGELAVRGGIVDVYPPHRPHPIRVEFWGDDIESIRDFDPASQRSQAKLAHVDLPPPRELLFDRDRVIAQGDAIRALGEKHEVSATAVDALIGDLLRGHLPPGIESLSPLLDPDLETVLDYLPEDTLIIVDDPDAGIDRWQRYYEDARHGFESACAADRASAPVELLLAEEASFTEALSTRKAIALERLDVADAEEDATRHKLEVRGHDELRRDLAKTRTHERALAPLADRLADWLLDDWRVVIAVSALSAADRLVDLLDDYGIEATIQTDPRPAWYWSGPGRLEIRVAPYSEGFILPDDKLVVIVEEEIFGRREKRRVRGAWKEGTAVEGIAQLEPGDYLVHHDHGIGTYRGLVELETSGGRSELLCIEYAGGDRLFLPVHRLNLVARYGQADGVKPRIDRLGGETWEKARTKVKKSMRHMAQELLAMHAARELAAGFAYSPRDAYFEEFEATFGFEETADQSSAIDDVLADMQKERPMDRLVCGDVGYGKTEVAIRAAFRAAMDGKQVVVLVPTTVLCQQHYETFVKRFSGYPVKLAQLSRFVTPAESRKALEGLADGSIDIVVATHRILQKNVQFRDLGLLVVDEEQRFGVAHKERIKKLKKTVDVLTLTATPIPRTLQMAFTGVRDLSIIETPPVDRLAIRTQVSRFSEPLIREAILREMRRGGQVFFLHNRVASIGAIEEMLNRVVPEARVIVAHGQMRERELDERMHAFMQGEAEVLLCTTIIESGIDIPRANTILINRADALGLAQLYQLRGRVGRSTHRAYAYLLIPAQLGNLSSDAQRRLEAIQDMTELGSGFRLAHMDLEIRGAGDLLGAEQSGNLRAVGYETYMEMLEETIEELRGRIHEEVIDPEIRLPVVARLPEAYVEDVSQRLVLYKRLSSAADGNELARIRDELLDRYGALPEEAANLIEVIRLKIAARKLGLISIGLARGEIVLAVAEQSQIDPQRLVQILTHAGNRLRVSPDHKIYAPAPDGAGGSAALFDAVHSTLKRLGVE